MRDARVGQQPLDIALYERQHVPTDNRQDSDSPDNRFPVWPRWIECDIEDTRKSNQRSCLGAHRHESCYRCRCAIIDIRRPGLKGYRRNLEGETDNKQTHTNEEECT